MSVVTDRRWLALDDTITGDVIVRGDPRMVLANKHFAAGRPLPTCEAMIGCRNADDVRRALEHVRQLDLPFSVRSGGHCFADFSSSEGAIVDLGGISHCRRTGEKSLAVGPGLCGGMLAPALAHAGLAFPTGGCPWVGIGGFCLVGGFGFLGRMFGLATHRLDALEVVTAGGDLLRCSRGNHDELFWGLRGGGAGGLGVVVSLTLVPLPFPDFRICFGAWPLSEAVSLLEVWRDHFACSDDPRINLEAGLLAPDDPDDPCHVKLYGLLMGPESETTQLLGRVERALGPLAGSLQSWVPERAQAAGYLCGLVDHRGGAAWQPCRPYQRCGYQFTRSHFLGSAPSDEALAACVRQFDATRRYAQCRELEFIPWGGAYAHEDRSAAFAHRDAHGMVRHTAMLGAFADEELRAASAGWVDASQATLVRHASGAVYQGYADWRLAEWENAYYGPDYPRLQALKAKYDPDNVFQHAQSIRLPMA
jgi:FAD/FMN-containing dehydrogenase